MCSVLGAAPRLAHARASVGRPSQARLLMNCWRERMGIEPTRGLFPDPPPVLKTGPGTSHGRAPGLVRP
jgi:hypothetical protein